MEIETLNKAQDLNIKINKTKEIILVLKENDKAYLYSDSTGMKYLVAHKLKKRLLPICEEYLKELEKEFEEL